MRSVFDIVQVPEFSFDTAGLVVVIRAEKAQAQKSLCLDLPLDLLEWVPANTLMSWVHEELQQKGNNWKAPDSTGRYYPDVPRALAGVVSFAYLAGIFDPEEIIRTSHSQPQLRTLLLGQALFPEDVIAFRRSNRSRLALLLSRVLARAVVWHNGLTGHLLPMDAFQTIHENAAHRVNLGRHMEPDVD